MYWLNTKRVTIVSEDEQSTSTGANFPTSGIPEELLASVVGSWNRWRILVILIFCIMMVFHGLNVFAPELFIPSHLGFNCNHSSILTYNSCFIINGSRCHTFKFSHLYGYTLIEKWNLVCDKQITVDVSNILFRSGMAIGYIMMGHFADRWGRKKILFISLVLQPCSGILVTTSKNYTFFSISRIFNGFSLSGTALMAIVLTCELSSNKWRTFDLGLLCLSFAIGHATLPFIWMILADSMKNILVMSIPQIILITTIGAIRESPNWLLCQNKTLTAESVLLSVARFNGQKMPSNFRLRPIQIINIASRRSMGFFSMLKPSKVRWVIIAACIITFLTTFINGLMLAVLSDEDENLFKMILLSGISSIVAAAGSLLLCHLISHKITIALSSVVGGAITSTAYVLTGSVHARNFLNFLYTFITMHGVISNWLFISFSVFLQHKVHKYLSMCVTAYGFHTLSLFTIWNVTPRVFPTEMRGEGTGVTIAIGELSFSFARLLLPILYNNKQTFLIMLWCCIVLIIMCCIVLASVHKRELPDIIEDAANFKNTCKPTRWTTLRGTSPTLDETEVNVVDFDRSSSK